METPIRYADRAVSLTDAAFLCEGLGSDAPDPRELAQRLAEDEPYRARTLGDQRAFDAVLAHDEALSAVSPRLFFEILLRRAVLDLRGTRYTVERSGSDRVPIFDAAEVVGVTARPPVLHYLAGLLASFTKVHSYTERVRVRRGVVRKVRYSDLDVRSMLRLVEQTSEEERLPLYRRTADLCLFILGVFPDFAATAHRYPGSGALRAPSNARRRLGVEEYETVAAQMYGLAAQRTGGGELRDVFHTLGAHVAEAKKPINFLSEHYVGFRHKRLFGAG